MRDEALEWLYRELKKAKIALGHAESRPGVTREELDNLQRKIDVLDYLTTLVNKEPVEE
jgi:hypothetical protein